MLWHEFVDTFTDTRTCLLKTIPLSMGWCKTIKDDQLCKSPLTVESFLQLVGTSKASAKFFPVTKNGTPCTRTKVGKARLGKRCVRLKFASGC